MIRKSRRKPAEERHLVVLRLNHDFEEGNSMNFTRLTNAAVNGKSLATALICSAALCTSAANAQTLTSNQTGTHGGHYYSFWKDSGNASFTLHSGGRYASQWDNSTNNWVGGKGWNPGGRKVFITRVITAWTTRKAPTSRFMAGPPTHSWNIT